MQNEPLEKLILQESTVENILHSLAEGIIAHDLQRRIFFFNRSAQQMTGFSAQDVIGRDCNEIFKPALCGEECGFCQGCETPVVKARTYTTVFLDQDGNRKEFEVRTIPLNDNEGKLVGVITCLNDMTTVHSLRRQLGAQEQFCGIVGLDHKMQAIFDLIKDLAQSDFPVLITGESGTGKELVARAIHTESGRRDKLFVPINCGALPEGTLESELFGHVRGSFTGAIRDKRGRFELADGGTLFLDEVAELTPAMQVKLLRVLQEGIIEPVGSERSRTVNVRILSATNRNLKELMKTGVFREDLFYRLAVVPVELPPLRDRRNDIPLIAERSIAAVREKIGRPGVTLSPETIAVMMSYSWPGNVRELQNSIQFGLIKCRGEAILPEHLPPEILTQVPLTVSRPISIQSPAIGHAGRRPKLSEELVKTAMTKSGGNKAKAARMLGVGRATLYNFIHSNTECAQWVSIQFPGIE